MTVGQWFGSWAGRWLGSLLGTRHRVTAQPLRLDASVGRPTIVLRPLPAPVVGGGGLAWTRQAPPRHRIGVRSVCMHATAGTPRVGKPRAGHRRAAWRDDEEMMLLD